MNGRTAMVAVAGILVPELMQKVGLPVGGQSKVEVSLSTSRPSCLHTRSSEEGPAVTGGQQVLEEGGHFCSAAGCVLSAGRTCLHSINIGNCDAFMDSLRAHLMLCLTAPCCLPTPGALVRRGQG